MPPTVAELHAAMKVLHVARNPPSDGRYLPYNQLQPCTIKALELDARVALTIAAQPERFYPLS